MKLKLNTSKRETVNTPATKTLRERLRGVRARPSLIFTLAVVVSAILWLVTALNDPSNGTIEVVFPVKYANLTTEYAFEEKPPLEIKAQIAVQGFSLLRYSIDPEGDTITHYVTDDDIRSKRFVVSEALMQQRVREKLGASAAIEWIYPANISIPFYRRSSKSVAIEHKILTDVRSGYILHPIAIEPDKIEIYGAKSALKEVSSIATEEISLSDVHESSTLEVGLVAPDGVLLERETVKASIVVEQLTEQTFEVEITPINVPAGKLLRPLPATVKIKIIIPASLYNRFQATDFQAIVDYNDIRQSAEHDAEELMQIELGRLPEEVDHYQLSPSRVQYVLEE